MLWIILGCLGFFILLLYIFQFISFIERVLLRIENNLRDISRKLSISKLDGEVEITIANLLDIVRQQTKSKS